MDEKQPKDYEFNDAEGTIISNLAKAMRFVGIASLILGILQGLGGVLVLAKPHASHSSSADSVGSLLILQGVFLAVIGALTQSASTFFAQIAKTEGSDIFNLMQALAKLQDMYFLQRAVILIAVVLIGLSAIYLVVAG